MDTHPGSADPPDGSASPRSEPALEAAVAVLMAGGLGTRFWPLSTARRPKQFLTHWFGRSLFRMAVDRALDLVSPDRLLVMTQAAFVEAVREQAPEVPPDNLILEPTRRDTAPANILAALVVEGRRPRSVMLVFPADHYIRGTDAFRATLTAAARRAASGGLGTIGVPPTRPATGYGYLRLAEPTEPLRPVPVEAFVEKPDRATAERYLAEGRYLWNSGIFVWRSDVLVEAAGRHAPATLAALAPLAPLAGTPDFAARARPAFDGVEAISIDFAVMEKADDIWCVPATFAWDDVGEWEALDRLLPADPDGNRARGPVTLDAVRRCIVIAEGDRPLAVAGLSDAIVVQGEAGTLVCPKAEAGRIRALVGRIQTDAPQAKKSAAEPEDQAGR